MGYLDPGLFGILSQIGLTVFLVVVVGFTFFLNPIKKVFSKIVGGKKQNQSGLPTNDKNIPQ